MNDFTPIFILELSSELTDFAEKKKRIFVRKKNPFREVCYHWTLPVVASYVEQKILLLGLV